MSPQSRKGARAPGLVPAEIRTRLEAGEPSANHMEQIATDMGALLETAFPDLADEADRLRCGGLVTKMRAGGQVLFEALGEEAWVAAGASESDSVRGWGAMAIGAAPAMSPAERLGLVRPFADDPHFAVREWAWLSLRPHVSAELGCAIGLLAAWTEEPSANLRRFASEVTRPRGVWSTHILALKQEPALGLPIISPLRRDENRYVQDSVGNWLNDASRSRPQWVAAICAEWTAPGDPRTERICRRGMRTLARAATVPGPGSSTLDPSGAASR